MFYQTVLIYGVHLAIDLVFVVFFHAIYQCALHKTRAKYAILVPKTTLLLVILFRAIYQCSLHKTRAVYTALVPKTTLLQISKD